MSISEKLLLDTSAYAAFKRGQSEALVALQKARHILLPVIVLGELRAGFAAGSRQVQNEQELVAFLQSGRVQVVVVTAVTSERYAHIYGYLRAIGRPIPTNDLWIAACTMEHGAELLTADAHFLQIPHILTRSLI